MAVANGKGGVGKTTVAANLAALWAAAGRRVDLDPQGNLASAFGLDDTLTHSPPASEPTGRAGLDYAAWPLTEAPDTAAEQLSAGLEASGWTSRYSIDGIATLLTRALAVGDGRIDPLGIVMFAVNPRATAIMRDTREELTGLLDDAIHVLDRTIRAAERAQIDAEHGGFVAAEYPVVLAQPEARKLRFAANARVLAADWKALAAEIDAQIARRNPCAAATS